MKKDAQATKKQRIMSYLSIFFAVATLIIMIYVIIMQISNTKSQNELSLYQNFEQIKHDAEILQIKLDSLNLLFESRNKEYKSLFTLIKDNEGIIRDANNISKNIILETTKNANKINNLENDFIRIRQAINPLNPEEILTIIRLKDEIFNLKESIDNLKLNLADEQKSFENSILREIGSYNYSANLILAVLIPLVLNFLYSVYKDYQTKKQTKDSKG